MARQSRRRLWREALRNAGLQPSAQGPEEDQMLYRWLRADMRRRTPERWRAVLASAIKLGRLIYRSFTEAYTEAFLVPDGPGVRLIRRYLQMRLGFVDPHAEEAVLERIRNRRLTLLEHLRRKVQPSLFGKVTFDASKLPGYLRRVAWVESLHVPEADLHRNRQPLSGQDPACEIPSLLGPEREEVDYLDLARRLCSFWGTANGFKREQQLEGLVSLGLGQLTGEPDLGSRCADLLSEKLPAWESRLVQLRRRSSRLLARWEETRDRLNGSTLAEKTKLQEELDEITRQLERCRQSLARHLTRLRPRPAEVRALLDGFVEQHTGGVRHKRIVKEIEILRQRVQVGLETLRSLPEESLPPEILELGARVETHLAGEPASPRQHGLSQSEKRDRRRLLKSWLAAGADVLARIRGTLGDLWARANPTHGESLAAWLCDAEDLYELGVLSHKGLMHGLGRRHGWRLCHLLRPAEPVRRSRTTLTR